MKAKELQQTIREAFANVPRPDENDITSHKCYECAEVRDSFKNITWRQADTEVLDHHHDSLPLFNPAAYYYFLPAYLIRALDEEDESRTESDGRHSILHENVIYSLCAVPPFNLRKLAILPFTHKQIESIIAFLEFALAEEEEGAWWNQEILEAIGKWKKLVRNIPVTSRQDAIPNIS